MPRYVYQCFACEDVFEIQHSYKEKQEQCIICGDPRIEKMLNNPIKIKALSDHVPKGGVGEVTKEAIEDSKKELQKQKDKFSKREHK